MDDKIWCWSATRIADSVRARDISSREAVLSYLSQIDEVNPGVNAIVSLQTQAALEAADAADRAVAAGDRLGPLHERAIHWLFQ